MSGRRICINNTVDAFHYRLVNYFLLPLYRNTMEATYPPATYLSTLPIQLRPLGKFSSTILWQ